MYGDTIKEFWVSMILIRNACLKVRLSKGISEIEIFAWGKGIYVSRKQVGVLNIVLKGLYESVHIILRDNVAKPVWSVSRIKVIIL